MAVFDHGSFRLPLMNLLFLLPSVFLYPQVPVRSVRGTILDSQTGKPVAEASVILTVNPIVGAISDSLGNFRINNCKPGRYSLKISHIGYQDQIIYDLLVTAGKEVVIETSLALKTNILGEVRIRGSGGINPADISNASTRIISIEETARYAATFNDPVRVTASYPGVMMMNDQANHAVIRGNSPTGLLWKIEGADVVNPNHLTNAGTFSDKPSITGGGVAIISSQLLSESLFLNGAFPAGYGNVISGVFDYKLRKGNNRKYEFTGQAGFLGLDFSAEGPFSKNYDGSYLINYRYSTIGLFELAGIPIGDEKINFQDLSFKISLPTKKAGDFNIFAIGGKSMTSFNSQRDSTKWLFEKDRTDYYFYSNMGVAGITHDIKSSLNSSFHTSLAISYLQSGRDEDIINHDYTSSVNGYNRLDAGKVSFLTYHTISRGKNSFRAGLSLNRDYNYFSLFPGNKDNEENIIENKTTYITLQPFIQVRSRVGKFLIEPGIHLLYSGFNRNFSPEPRVSLSFTPKAGMKVYAGYGLHSIMQYPSVYFNNIEANRLLGLTKAHHFVIGYSDWISDDLYLNAEIYYQHIFDIPVSRDASDSFSAINLNETEIINEYLANKGTGNNYGIDLSLERSMQKGFYYILSGSLYKSEYRGSDGTLRSTRYNGKYQSKITSGKEFNFTVRKGTNNLGINITAILAGGMRYTPVDPELSSLRASTVLNEESAFSEKLRDFIRVDLRLSWRKDRNGYTETFAIDIQNLTNRKNTAWFYYDQLRKSVTTKNQLGIIPFFSYRINF
jgi:hypothetical protein